MKKKNKKQSRKDNKKDSQNKLLNRSQLASAFDVSVNTIASWVQKGCPFIQKGRNGKQWIFNLSDVINWHKEYFLQEDVDEKEIIDGILPLKQARALREHYRAMCQRIEYETLTGKLVLAEEIKKTAYSTGRKIRESIMNIPDRLAPVLAAESNAHKIHVLLTKELNQALEELQDVKRN